jgi:hypothetical protein
MRPAKRAAGGVRGNGTLLVALLLAGVAAVSPLDFGFYDYGAWAPITLGAVLLLVTVLFRVPLSVSRAGALALAGMLALLSLSALSLLWAQSRESAWTDTNRLALYVVILTIGLLVIRSVGHARTVLLVLGLPGLVAAALAAVTFLVTVPEGWFTLGRLGWPVGYINGTAGLLVMASWPWIALADGAERRWVRSAGLAAAAAVLALAVLTQARAIELEAGAAALATIALLPGRTRRSAKLLLLLVAVLATVPLTLRPYAVTGAGQSLPITAGALRGAGLGIIGSALIAGLLHQFVSAMAGRLSAVRRRQLDRRTGRALLAAVVLAVGLGVALDHATLSRQYDNFTQMRISGLESGNRLLFAGGFRYDLWRVAIAEWREHPLVGVGAGNYDTDYYRLRRNPEYVLQPHSLELQMLAELGGLGLLALLVFLAAVSWAAGLRRGTLAAADPVLTVGAIGIFVAWLAGTSVDWLYDIPGVTMPAMLAAAVLLARPRTPAGTPDGVTAGPGAPPGAQLAGRRGAQIAGLAVLALLAASVGRQYAGSRYAASGAASLQAGRPTAALRRLTTARELDPYSLPVLYSISAAYARLNDYAGARDALLTAQRLEPGNYVPPALLGDLAVLRGLPAVAVREYDRALTLDPRDPQLQARLARVEAGGG